MTSGKCPWKSHPAWNKGLSKEFQPRYGKTHSDETKEKMRLKALNRKHTELTKIKISLIQKGKKRKPQSKETRLKISLKHKNKVLSTEHKKKLSLAHIGKLVGEQNPNWRGGIMNDPYTLDFNTKFKNKIRKRDEQLCQLCGIHREKIKYSFHIHHINYDKKLSLPQNCITLCNNCHGLTNKNRKFWIDFFQKLLSKKHSYLYDGHKIVIDLTAENSQNGNKYEKTN